MSDIKDWFKRLDCVEFEDAANQPYHDYYRYYKHLDFDYDASRDGMIESVLQKTSETGFKGGYALAWSHQQSEITQLQKEVDKLRDMRNDDQIVLGKVKQREYELQKEKEEILKDIKEVLAGFNICDIEDCATPAIKRLYERIDHK